MTTLEALKADRARKIAIDIQATHDREITRLMRNALEARYAHPVHQAMIADEQVLDLIEHLAYRFSGVAGYDYDRLMAAVEGMRSECDG